MVGQSLKDKTIVGVGWSAADAILGHGVTFLVGLVLARILTPSEYGLIGIVSIFVVVLTGIVDSGFSNALIRKRDASDTDYNTMFITNLLVSTFLYFVLFFSAPYIALFFERDELIALIRVMGVILIIQALSLTQITILTKKIDFKTKTKASVVSAVLSGIIGIVMAFLGIGVWALVGQQLSNKVIYTVALWVMNRWCPSFKFSRNSFIYMWGFGWKLMLSGILNNLWGQLYRVVVGKFYAPAILGQYTRAGEYANLFSSNLTLIVQRVSYPALSEVQDDMQRMVSAYRKVIKTTMFVTCVCLLFMASVSEPLIFCLIGPQWQIAATFLPLICISHTLYPLHAINLNMLQIQGRSDVFLILEIVKKVLAIGPLLLGIFVSIYWMVIGTIVTGIISFFLNSYYTGRKLNYSSWMQLRDVAPSYGIAFVVAASVFFFKYMPLSNWIILPIQIIVGAIVFFIVCEVTKMGEYTEIKEIAKQYISKFKRK